MLAGYNAVFQTLLGTLFTWGLTAAGAALVFVFHSSQRKVLDASLGFAAGVMTAASYWSLLNPAIEMAEHSGFYGDKGQWAFVPVAIGFILGAGFVYGADIFMPYLGVDDASSLMMSLDSSMKEEKDGDIQMESSTNNFYDINRQQSFSQPLRRKPTQEQINMDSSYISSPAPSKSQAINWKRILLLIIAITIHNIPEGLAVGVGFGAVGKSPAATFENARNLAIGIGIQNFPEGLAVSLPLRGAGMSIWKSFWFGQLSGMVEPVAGLLGAIAVVIAEPILPYALAFAAGAMIYVVVDDIVPEAQTCGNGKISSWGAVIGFVVMMSLDVGLG
ncbi:zinc transporter ZIP11-like [Saccostrea echinata]|uniref:zinc transporter ZIP11-like n=1 Tax=Saccostrea echinata TaxID=191078 RepID=UPI002A7F73E8|nr:zinc transporter ZIP11-like [Saccostrea echinata]